MSSSLRGAFAVTALLFEAGCDHAPPASGQPHVVYVVGPAWHGDHAWFYPREQASSSMTGLAVPLSCRAADGPLADGNRCLASVPQAAVQSLQLPVILRVTNLENGNQALVRADDRGPASPDRVIALNPLAMSLLGMSPSEPGRVRLEIDGELSEAAIAGLPGAPHAEIDPAPEVVVEERPLNSPRAIAATQSGEHATPSAERPIDVDARLRSQEVQHVSVVQTSLWVDLGVFSTSSIARTIAAEADGLATAVQAGRNAVMVVRSGPFNSIAAADAALKRALDRGIKGARIVVE